MTTLGDFPRWVSQINDDERSTFRPESVGYTSKDGFKRFMYACNRSQPPQRAQEEASCETASDRYTGCTARMHCYTFEPDLGNNAPVYVVRSGTHNHNDGKHMRLSAYSKEYYANQLRGGVRVSTLLEGVEQLKAGVEQLRAYKALHPEAPLPMGLQTDLPKSLTPTAQELYRLKYKVLGKQRTKSGEESGHDPNPERAGSVSSEELSSQAHDRSDHVDMSTQVNQGDQNVY